jgi:hypothetical protein
VRGESLGPAAGVGQEVEIGVRELEVDEVDYRDLRRGGEVGFQIVAE